MASHRRPKQPSRTRVTIFGATAAATVVLSSQAAQADPSSGPSKDEVKEQVDELYEEVTKVNEEYVGAQEKEEALQEEADELQDTVTRGQEELNELRDGLGSVASAQYRNGGIDPSLQLFLSSDPDDYLAQAATLDHVTGKQAEALQKIQSKQRTLAQQREEATEKLEELEETREEAGEKKQEIQDKLNEAQRLLNQLTAEEQAALAAEEAEAAQEAERAATRADRSEERSDLTDEAPAGSSRASSALGVAQSKLGSPYVYASAGPNSFDCSGLTSWAFQQTGVSLPRTSQAQANVGTRVTKDQLQPGDLVFFYADLGHVGIYSGNGQMVHAPRPGTVVRYESIDVMPFQFGVRVG